MGRYFSGPAVPTRGNYFADPCKVCPRAVPDTVTDADVAAAVVEIYNPTDPETWDVGEEERETLSAEEVATLAWQRYQEALAVLAAQGSQKAAGKGGKPRLRCPKGTAKGGRFTSSLDNCGGPSKGSQKPKGKTPAKTKTLFEKHLGELKKVSDFEFARKLREKLNVKDPVRDRVVGVFGARDRAEAERLQGYAQEVIDMLPARVARGLPRFTIHKENLPFSGAWWQGQKKLSVSDSLPDYQQRRIIYHEMGHWIQNNAPPSYRQALREHYQERTAGEALKEHDAGNGQTYKSRDDQFFNYYNGLDYPSSDARHGSGPELLSTQLEHMTGGLHYSERRKDQGLSSSTSMGEAMREEGDRGKYYRETAATVLSLFYYGRE